MLGHRAREFRPLTAVSLEEDASTLSKLVAEYHGKRSGGSSLCFQKRKNFTVETLSAEAYTRLQMLKYKYDPQNMFSHSYDIPPVK